jgi:CheY-like chemotaxis protein
MCAKRIAFRSKRNRHLLVLCDTQRNVSAPPPPKGPQSPAAPQSPAVSRRQGFSEPPPELAGAVVSNEPFRAGTPIAPETLEEIEEFEVVDEEPAPSVASAPRLAVAAPVPASVHRDPAARVVMVVEDDASIRSMIVRALGMSYTVFEADDGQTALDILAVIPPPACIISDWMMPRVDGVTLAKQVRADKNLKWTPLLLLTAKNHPLEVVQGINAGARHYLAKPFKMKELLDKVASVLSKNNQLPTR